MGKSGTSSLFLKVAELDESDQRASKRRKVHTERSQLQAKATKSQLEMSNVLMEMRILLQRGLQAANKDKHANTNEESNDDHVKPVLTTLVEARHAMLNALKRNESDDSDASNVEDKNESEQIDYNSCRSMWKQVLNKRQEDLLLSAGNGSTTQKKFQVIDQSLWTQVEATLAHEKLRQFVHNGKSRDDDKFDETSSENNETSNVAVADFSGNIFDDSKVYAHMLKDFITHSSSGTNVIDANLLRQRSNNKKKNKKDVDTRASKGRKLRFTVNEKLTNFTFPVSRPVPFLSEDDWFKSLFGGLSRVQQRKV